MAQTQKSSFLEVCINNILGLFTAWATWVWIIIAWTQFYGLDANHFTFFQVTLVNIAFTIVGILRGYLCRRFFNLFDCKGGE
jgi:hypothetical protein